MDLLECLSLYLTLHGLSCFAEKGEFNRKVCIHCNATFHSGVSLSNHLRAYARRKRTALLEGTSKSNTSKNIIQHTVRSMVIQIEQSFVIIRLFQEDGVGECRILKQTKAEWTSR